MAPKRKENSLVFALKELKDISAEAAPPKPARRPSALEGADDLLGDIRGLIGNAAEEEAAALEAQKEAERRAAEAEIRRTQQAQKAQIEARIAAERARQQAAEEERAARQRLIDIAEGRVAPDPEPQVVVARPMMQEPVVMQPQAPQRGTGFYLAVVGLPLVCLTAVVVAMILQPEPQPHQSQPQEVVKNPDPVVHQTLPVVYKPDVGVFKEIPEVEVPVKPEKKIVKKGIKKGNNVRKKKGTVRRGSSSKKTTPKTKTEGGLFENGFDISKDL